MTYAMADARSRGPAVPGDKPYVSIPLTCDECGAMVIAYARMGEERLASATTHLKRFIEAGKAEWEPTHVLGKSFPDIPPEIAAPANEAFECFSIGAYRSAVLMARSVLEASAKIKGVTAGNLFAKIDKLAEQQHIRTLIAEAAHEVRLAGNDMAHGDFATADIAKDDAEELLEFMEDFLKELFETPTRIARRKQKREAAQ